MLTLMALPRSREKTVPSLPTSASGGAVSDLGLVRKMRKARSIQASSGLTHPIPRTCDYAEGCDPYHWEPAQCLLLRPGATWLTPNMLRRLPRAASSGPPYHQLLFYWRLLSPSPWSDPQNLPTERAGGLPSSPLHSAPRTSLQPILLTSPPGNRASKAATSSHPVGSHRG